ncbi:F-box protein [Capsicum galapagoense]
MSLNAAPILSDLIAEKIEGSDDLLSKILLPLPARPLFSLNLSKVHSFWNHHMLCMTLVTFPSKKKQTLRFLDFIKVDPADAVEVFNSCDGLVLCRNRSANRIRDDYMVCNPTTWEFKTLPSPKVGSPNFTLAFDHSISPHYKVICVGLHFLGLEEGVELCFPIEIHSSDTNSWRLSQAQFPNTYGDYLYHSKRVFLNGAVYWICKEVNSFCYFDIDREIIQSSQIPEMDEQYFCGCVHGNLHLVGSSVGEIYRINIFVLGNDYSSWSLKYRIDQHKLTLHGSRYMVYGPRCTGDFSFLDVSFTVLSLLAREGNQEPYLDLYQPHETKLFRLKDRTYWKLPFPSVHQLIENPFWIGSKMSNICQ